MARCYGYRGASDQIFQFVPAFATPCPSGLGCCAPNDLCLANNICKFNHSQPAGFYSGYYMGACTDPTYTSPSCPKQCSSLVAPDVAYNYTSNIWSCCGTNVNGTVSCNKPTNEQFSAPAPDALSTVQLLSSTTLVTRTASASTTTTSTSTSTSSNPSSTTTAAAASNTLSNGANAGIGVGASLGGVLLIALLVWAIMRYRSSHRVIRPTYAPALNEEEVYPRGGMPLYHEKDSYNQPPQELAAR